MGIIGYLDGPTFAGPHAELEAAIYDAERGGDKTLAGALSTQLSRQLAEEERTANVAALSQAASSSFEPVRTGPMGFLRRALDAITL